MNERQLTAFQVASGVSAEQLTLAITGVTLMIALLWASWLAISSLIAWQSGQQSLLELITSILRACVLLLILGYYIR